MPKRKGGVVKSIKRKDENKEKVKTGVRFKRQAPERAYQDAAISCLAKVKIRAQVIFDMAQNSSSSSQIVSSEYIGDYLPCKIDQQTGEICDKSSKNMKEKQRFQILHHFASQIVKGKFCWWKIDENDLDGEDPDSIIAYVKNNDDEKSFYTKTLDVQLFYISSFHIHVGNWDDVDENDRMLSLFHEASQVVLSAKEIVEGQDKCKRLGDDEKLKNQDNYGNFFIYELDESKLAPKTSTSTELTKEQLAELQAVMKKYEVKEGEDTVEIEDSEVKDDEAIIIARMLYNNTTLTELSLHNNEIGDSGAKAFAEALKTNSTLTQLWFNKNKISDEGAKAIRESLNDHNTTMKAIYFAKNPISEETKKSLNELLDNHPSLRAVNAVRKRKFDLN